MIKPKKTQNIFNFISFINKSIMQHSLNLKGVLAQKNSQVKVHNRSLKTLDHVRKLKEISQSRQKNIVSMSTRNLSYRKQGKPTSSKYFLKSQLSVEDRLRTQNNKENVKFPQICHTKIKIPLEQKSKKYQLKIKSSNGKRLLTENDSSNFLTIGDDIERATHIKDTLLEILSSETRKSKTLQGQMDKLSELTNKGAMLRKNLRSIQEDMLTLSFKKKLSKIYLKTDYSQAQ